MRAGGDFKFKYKCLSHRQDMTQYPLPPSGRARAEGALFGLFIGDALAMPAHWYYNTAALRRDYGTISDYLQPRNPHPDSILWRSQYAAPEPRYDILHDQARFWGKPGVHYHQFLKAGENTLNLKLCRILVHSLLEKNGYDPDDYLKTLHRLHDDTGQPQGHVRRGVSSPLLCPAG